MRLLSPKSLSIMTADGILALCPAVFEKVAKSRGNDMVGLLSVMLFAWSVCVLEWSLGSSWCCVVALRLLGCWHASSSLFPSSGPKGKYHVFCVELLIMFEEWSQRGSFADEVVL